MFLRPIYLDQNERTTLKQKELDEIELLAYEEKEKKLKEEKKLETKKIVLNYLLEDELGAKKNETDDNSRQLPDDNDNIDDLKEYEQWKIRELNRIKRAVLEEKQKIDDMLEIERRRNLTDDQRKEENLKLGSDDTIRAFKSKYVFMQKYYRNGVFFNDLAQNDKDHILNRDYNIATADERINKSVLPKILQKRRGLFGKRSQSKYTHLVDQDTTCFEKDFKVPENLFEKSLQSAGGIKSSNKFDAKYK